ncbi:MAG: phage holin family protein [Sphingobacteriaceae bacterium]|jgi:hypothetical protein|nr:MAG: phage holin family protein [Pedobacter sp.]
MKDYTEDQPIINAVKDYLKTRKELTLLKFVSKGSKTIALGVAFINVGVLATFSLLFFSISAGFYLADKVGSASLGFLIVAGFYLLVTLIVFLTRKNLIERPLIDILIKQFLKERNKMIYENQN